MNLFLTSVDVANQKIHRRHDDVLTSRFAAGTSNSNLPFPPVAPLARMRRRCYERYDNHADDGAGDRHFRVVQRLADVTVDLHAAAPQLG